MRRGPKTAHGASNSRAAPVRRNRSRIQASTAVWGARTNFNYVVANESFGLSKPKDHTSESAATKCTKVLNHVAPRRRPRGRRHQQRQPGNQRAMPQEAHTKLAVSSGPSVALPTDVLLVQNLPLVLQNRKTKSCSYRSLSLWSL